MIAKIKKHHVENTVVFLKNEKIQYKNLHYYLNALIHTSYANECKTPEMSYERLEFLGDAVLELFVSDYFFTHFPELNEGMMTKKRAAVVREESLVLYAQSINLPEYMILGKGETLSGGKERAAIIADCFEALLGAIYIDLGKETAFEFANKWIVPFIVSEHVFTERDFKTSLQELIQGDGAHEIHYAIIDEIGPAHAKQFTAVVKLDNVILGEGTGKTKKEAEQSAAKSAMQILARAKEVKN